jgi:hypothetical protein
MVTRFACNIDNLGKANLTVPQISKFIRITKVSYCHDAQPNILGRGLAAMKASTICKKQEIGQAMKETMNIKHSDCSICSGAYVQIIRIVADVYGHNIEYL